MIDWDALLIREEPAETTAAVESDAPKAPPQLCPDILARQQDGDNRRRCTECANLATHGVCLAAYRGEILASRTYHPVVTLLRRCEGYKPLPIDCDQRPVSERWPGLIRP